MTEQTLDVHSVHYYVMTVDSTGMQGKYLDKDGGPKQARLNKYKGRYAEAESRYGPRPNVVAAVQAYVDLAKQSGVSSTALALRWVFLFNRLTWNRKGITFACIDSPWHVNAICQDNPSHTASYSGLYVPCPSKQTHVNITVICSRAQHCSKLQSCADC